MPDNIFSGNVFLRSADTGVNKGFTVIDQPAHGLKNGQPVYRGTGSYELAIASEADGLIKGQLAGVVAGATLNTFIIVSAGKITNVDGSIIDGTSYFVSSTVAGGRVTVAPVSPDYEIPFLIGGADNTAIVKLQLGVVGA